VKTPEIAERLQQRWGEKLLRTDLEAKDPFIVVDAASLAEIGFFLRDEPELAFDTLHCISVVDFPKEDRLEVVYHLTSIKLRHWLVVKVETARDATARVPTVEGIWPTANWHEREAYDLFGVWFEGHRDLRRILLPDDWEGHPLRKDWVWPETWHGIAVKPGKQMTERAAEGETLGVGPFD
jgi:NADH-quinone oxidoreductase subunit C